MLSAVRRISARRGGRSTRSTTRLRFTSQRTTTNATTHTGTKRIDESFEAVASATRRRGAALMGVLNVTPDSFFDGGRYLDRAAADAGKTLPILLQINAGDDPAKFGADLADAPRLLEAALTKRNLRVDGLMTIAPLGATVDETAAHAERTFTNLRTRRDELAARFGVPLRELSMGMTSDLAIAVAAGSTLVRVGTALFGVRDARH